MFALSLNEIGLTLGLILLVCPPLIFGLTLTVIVRSGFHGSLTAALQVITPNQMRGANTAFLNIAINFGGLAIGSAVIGLITTGYGDDPMAIGYAMAFVTIGGALFATAMALLFLRHYRGVARAHFS